MKQILLVSALALSAMTAVGWLTPAAYAAPNIKDCGTVTTDVTNPPNSSADFSTDTTTTQTSACNSNSDTNQVITTTCVKNKAGNCTGQ